MFKLGLLSIVAVVALAFSGIGQTEAVAQVNNVKSAVTAPAASQVVAPTQAGEDDVLPMSNCFMCSKSSSGACSGAQECAGTRKSCRKKGCKITGTRSCSSAANVKRC